MGHDELEIDPGLVEIENALDQHERVRKNSVDPMRLKRATTELESALHRNEEDNAAVDDYLAERR